MASPPAALALALRLQFQRHPAVRHTAQEVVRLVFQARDGGLHQQRLHAALAERLRQFAIRSGLACQRVLPRLGVREFGGGLRYLARLVLQRALAGLQAGRAAPTQPPTPPRPACAAPSTTAVR